MPQTRPGSCLCGAVQYKLTGDPEKFFVCHCESCQKFTGSAFMANCWFKRSQLEITHGQNSLKTYQDKATHSGNALKRVFCGTCASNLFMHNDPMDEAQYVSVTSGTIENRVGLNPTVEVWTTGRREWVKPIEGAEKMERQ